MLSADKAKTGSVKAAPLFIWSWVSLPGLAFGQAASVPRAGSAASAASAAAAPSSSETLRARFRFDAGAPLLAPAGVAPDGTICVGTADGYIHLLGPDGSYRWSYSVHGAVTRPPLFAGELWYVATSAERIYALTRAGMLYWVFRPPSSIVSELAADPRGLLYFVASDRFLYGVTAHGGISLRAPFGVPLAGPRAASDGAIWLENAAGSRLRVLGRAVRRYSEDAPHEFEFNAPDTVQDPEGRSWRASATGVLELRGAPSEPCSLLLTLTSSPLFPPAWSAAAHYAVVSARNGLVIAVEPPHRRPS